MENDSLLRRLSATAEKAMLVDSKVKKAVEELFWIAVAKSQDPEHAGDVFYIYWEFNSREVYEEWQANGSNYENYHELGSFEGLLRSGARSEPISTQVDELLKNLPAGFNVNCEGVRHEDYDDPEVGDWYEECFIIFENQEALLESSVFIEGVLNQATSLQTDSPIHQWMLTFVLETFTTAE